MPSAPPAVKDLISAVSQAGASGTRAPAPGPPRPRSLRLAGLLRPRSKTGGTYQDPLFRRPEVVEDDYYRLVRQPRGG